jgi:hypothetical protein
MAHWSESYQTRVKVYLVLQRQNVFKRGEPNVKILAARLNRRLAQEVVDTIPGTWIEKQYAVK